MCFLNCVKTRQTVSLRSRIYYGRRNSRESFCREPGRSIRRDSPRKHSAVCAVGFIPHLAHEIAKWVEFIYLYPKKLQQILHIVTHRLHCRYNKRIILKYVTLSRFKVIYRIIVYFSNRILALPTTSRFSAKLL